MGSSADDAGKIDDDLMFDNKSAAENPSSTPAKGKEFDFLSMFDEQPKQPANST